MAEKDYTSLAQSIYHEVGGKDNIDHIAHCATRLRFNLKDETIVQDEQLKKMKEVLGVAHAGGQFQVIIGPNVQQVFQEVIKIHDQKPMTSEKTDTGQAHSKAGFSLKKILTNMLDGLSGSLTPAIPAITVAAFFKTIAAVFGPSMLNWLSETSDLYVLATFVGDTTFYFFPVLIGYTAAKKFKTSPLLGILLGAIMIHPTFMAMATEGASFSVFGIPAMVENYSSTILPIIISVWVMSYVDRFINKQLSEMVRGFLAPALTIAIMLPIALCVVGPLGAFIGTAVSDGILNMRGLVGFLGVALIGGTFSLLILTGMHIILITALIQVFMENGSESFVAPGLSAASFAILGMALGAALKLRKKEDRSLAWGFFTTMFLSGTSEPALYGIGIRYKRPMIGLIIGGFAGGLYMGILNVGHYTLIPLTNIVSLLSFSGSTTANLVNGIIGCVISVVVAAGLTYFMGFEEEPGLKE